MDSFILELLQEAPVSWKTIQKTFLSKYGEEGLDKIAKSIKFNNFQEFYQDVYDILYKNMGGKKYEPTSTELIKIFKFLLESPKTYKIIKPFLGIYGHYRYLGNAEVFDKLIKVKTSDEFIDFISKLENPLVGDLAINYDEYLKVYSTSDIDVYYMPDHESMEPVCVGTTWCTKEQGMFDYYSKSTEFYVIISKKEWYEQKSGTRKKYALRLPHIISNPDIAKSEAALMKLINLNEEEFSKIFLSSESLKAQINHLYNYIAENLDMKDLEFSYKYPWVKILNQLNSLQKLEIKDDRIIYYSEWHKDGSVWKFSDWRTYFEINFAKNKIQELLDELRPINYDLLFKRFDELMEAIFSNHLIDWADTETGEGKIFEKIPHFKEIKEIFSDPSRETFSEFTNNIQNVRIQNFDKLPEPYHSQLKGFDKYRIYLNINNLISTLNNKIRALMEANTNLLKKKCIEMFKERLEKNDLDYYEKLIKTLSDIQKEKFPVLKNLVFYDNYYFTEIKTKEDFIFFTFRNWHYFWKDNLKDKIDYYFIKDKEAGLGNYIIVGTFNNDVLKDLELRLNAMLNNLNMNENDLKEFMTAVQYENIKPTRIKIYEKIFDRLKEKAKRINKLIQTNDLDSFSVSRNESIIKLFKFVKENPVTNNEIVNNPKLNEIVNVKIENLLLYIKDLDHEKIVSLVKSLLLNSLMGSVIVDLDVFKGIIGPEFDDYIRTAPGSFMTIFSPKYAFTFKSDLVGFVGAGVDEFQFKEISKELSDVNFMINLTKSVKILNILKGLHNINDHYITFIDGDKDSVQDLCADSIAKIINRDFKTCLMTVTFDNVIDTTEEIERMAKLLKHLANK